MISFTGTQDGMTNAQEFKLVSLLHILRTFHLGFMHGDCVGSDFRAHQVAYHYQFRIFIRPCTITRKRAFCKPAFRVYDPELPMKRNQKIVTDGSVLIATPRQFSEELRSGTWATIRRARKLHRPIMIIQPDGHLIIENEYSPSGDRTYSVKGRGFDIRNGGFAKIIIDGQEYDAQDIASRIIGAKS